MKHSRNGLAVAPPRRVRERFMKTSRALKASRSLREGFAKASRRLQPYPRRLREGFAKAPRAPPFGNDSSDNDKPENNMKKTQRKSQHLRENMYQVPKTNMFRKTKSRLGQENPKKKVEPIAPAQKLSHKQNILYRSTNTSKTKLEEEAIPPPLRSRGVFIVGFPPIRPSPLNTLEL